MDWRRLSLGLLISLIIVCVIGIVLSSMNVIQVDNGWYSAFSGLPTDKLDAISGCLSENNIEITIVSNGGGSNSIFLSLWIWIMIGLFSILGITLFFYMGSGLINKK